MYQKKKKNRLFNYLTHYDIFFLRFEGRALLFKISKINILPVSRVIIYHKRRGGTRPIREGPVLPLIVQRHRFKQSRTNTRRKL